MATAIFRCPKCQKTFQVKFSAGKPLEKYCEECQVKAERVFKNIELNEVVSDDMLHIGQMMLYT